MDPGPRVRQSRDAPHRAGRLRGQHHNSLCALWYNIVAISTVGYGDGYPVTNEGRIAGSLIIIVGVAIFDTFTGYLANLFVSPSKKRAGAPPPVTAQDPQLNTGQLQALMAQDGNGAPADGSVCRDT